MSRKITVRVENYPPLRAGRACRLLVLHVEKQDRARLMEVTLKNLDGEHDGRIHRLLLALPVRPGGLTAEFLRAIGQDVVVDQSIALADLTGRTLMGTCGLAADKEMTFVSFSAAPEEAGHVTEPE